jgi:hypothetical protein
MIRRLFNFHQPTLTREKRECLPEFDYEPHLIVDIPILLIAVFRYNCTK